MLTNEVLLFIAKGLMVGYIVTGLFVGISLALQILRNSTGDRTLIIIGALVVGVGIGILWPLYLVVMYKINIKGAKTPKSDD